MKKADRQKVFDKYGGKCAYCGCELEKGWHVDEIEPVRRLRKYVHSHYRHKETKEVLEQHIAYRMSEEQLDSYEFIPGKMVQDGCLHPERFNLDNQMPACASCNINKHSDSLEDFRRLILGFHKSLNERITQYKIAKRFGMVVEQEWDGLFYFERVAKENAA